MRLLPKSLFGRMVLILLSGLFLAQVLSVVLLLRDRGEIVYHASALYLAQRIAQAVRLLDSLSPAEQRRVVPVLEAPLLWVSLSDQPRSVAEDGEAVTQYAPVFTAFLRRHLGTERPIRVAVREGTTPAPWGGPGRGMMQRRMAGAGLAPGQGLSFIVQVQLQDGAWVMFDHRITEQLFAWPHRLLLTLLVLLVSVIVVSLLAVRWITRPLSVLANAAEQLGKDIHSPPLSESGPVEVRRAARAFNRMQKRLTRFIQDRTRVLAAVSHDLRTPITRLKLRAESIEDPNLMAKVQKDLDEMQAMVSATLDFMRSADSREPMQPVDVGALLESLQADGEEVGQEVHIEGKPRTPYTCRPLALKRCLTNLINNAVKYGQRASIKIEDGAEQLCITIADEGPGIPEAELERVFEPFYRLEVSRSRDTGGVGLGLGIARNIARAHGGDVVLRNRPEGKGLEAVLTLPR